MDGLGARELPAGGRGQALSAGAAWNGRGAVTCGRSSDLKMRSSAFVPCCSVAQQQVEHRRDDHSLPKDRAGKIWERSIDRSPVLGLVLKGKTVLMQTRYATWPFHVSF